MNNNNSVDGPALGDRYSAAIDNLLSNKNPFGLTSLHLDGSITSTEVVNEIYKHFYNDKSCLLQIVAKLRANSDHDFGFIADRLESLAEQQNA